MAKDGKGVTGCCSNGKFVFEIGTLDQGFWPDGIYTAPTDEALRFDIEVTKKLGFNMIRKHVKVEPERWYYWCDKLGMLVWQDMPAGDNKTTRGEAASSSRRAGAHGADATGTTRRIIDVGASSTRAGASTTPSG